MIILKYVETVNHQYPTKNAQFICRSISAAYIIVLVSAIIFLAGAEDKLFLLAVTRKIGGLTLFLDFSDRCANTRSLHLPPAAVACVARHARALFQEFYAQTKKQAPQKRCLFFWQGQKDLAYAAALPCILMARRPKFCEFQYPPHRSSLKTVH